MKNKNNLVGLGLLMLGVLLSAGTAWLFPVCGPKDDGTWMKCHWSGQVTIGIGVVFVVIALAYLVCSNRHIRAGLSLATIPVGALNIAIVNGLIGLCGRVEMQCRAITKPSVMIVDAVVIVLGIANALRILRFRSKPSEIGSTEPLR